MGVGAEALWGSACLGVDTKGGEDRQYGGWAWVVHTNQKG